MENTNKKYVVGAIIVAVGIIVIGFLNVKPVSAPDSTNSTSTISIVGKYDDFAKCTASKGLAMYGAVWCSHCLEQKKLFGESFKYVNYVECPDNIKLCTDKGINGYPTWLDNAGNKYEGSQSLEKIAEITGCEFNK